MLSIMEPQATEVVTAQLKDITGTENGDCSACDKADAKVGGAGDNAGSNDGDCIMNGGDGVAKSGSGRPSSGEGACEDANRVDVSISGNDNSEVSDSDQKPDPTGPVRPKSSVPRKQDQSEPVKLGPSETVGDTSSDDGEPVVPTDIPPKPCEISSSPVLGSSTPMKASPSNGIPAVIITAPLDSPPPCDTTKQSTPEASGSTTTKSEDDIVLHLSESEAGEQDMETMDDEDVLLKDDEGESSQPETGEPASTSTSSAPTSVVGQTPVVPPADVPASSPDDKPSEAPADESSKSDVTSEANGNAESADSDKPADVTEVILQDDDDVISAGDEYATSIADDKASPQAGDVTRLQADDVTPQDDDNIMLQADQAISQADDGATSHAIDGTTSQADDAATSQPDDNATSQTGDDTKLQADDDALQDDDVMPQADDDATSQTDDDATSLADDDATSQADDDATSQVDDDATSQADDDATSQANDVMLQAHDNVTSKADEAAPQTDDKTMSDDPTEPEGETDMTSQPETTSTDGMTSKADDNATSGDIVTKQADDKSTSVDANAVAAPDNDVDMRPDNPVEGDEPPPPGHADPVDLPDEMFESAQALKAAEEEEELARRQAEDALACLEHAEEFLDEDTNDGFTGGDESRDGMYTGDDDTSRDVDTDTNDVCIAEGTVEGQFSVEDSCDGVDGLGNAEVEEGTDEMHVEEHDVSESVDAVNEDESSVDVGETNDSRNVSDEGPSDSNNALLVGEVTGALSESSNDAMPEDESTKTSNPTDDSVNPPNPDLISDEKPESGDPLASRKRSHSGTSSPESVAKQRKISGNEAPAPVTSSVKPRNFIEVKKVQLSEVNQRLLKESNERERRRLESATPASTPSSTAASATVVNGAVKSSLLKKVKHLSREELETLVLEKMCESIASKSVIADMKRSADKHVTAAERFQKKITHLQKQVGDLHLVVRKLSAEMKSRRTPTFPVKITRTVGLQVTLAKSIPPLTQVGRGRSTNFGIVTSGTPGPSEGTLRSHLMSSSSRAHAVQARSAPGMTMPRPAAPAQGAGRAAVTQPGRGRPPLRPMVVSPQRGQQAALGLPLVRAVPTTLGSVPLPQRSIAAVVNQPVGKRYGRSTAINQLVGKRWGRPTAINQPVRPAVAVLHSPGRRGRPPRLHPAPSASSSASSAPAAVVDLTDDDDKRPAVVSPPRRTTTTITTVSRTPAPPRAVRPMGAHPAPFPVTPPNPVVNTVQLLPPPPELKVTRRANGIVLSWTMDLTPRHATIVSYHLFAYQQSGPVNPRSNPWKKVGDVKALPLPMACTLTQFQEGHKYHFAVRAEDNFRRRGPFSNPSSIALLGT